MIQTITVIFNAFREQGKVPIAAYLPYSFYSCLYDEVKTMAPKENRPDPMPVNFWFGDVVVMCGKDAFLVEFQEG